MSARGRWEEFLALCVVSALALVATGAVATEAASTGGSPVPSTPGYPPPYVPPHNPSLNRFTPNTVSFWSAKHGLVGTGEEYDNHGHGGKIELTTNGGRSFKVVARTKRAVAWIDTAGVKDAWAALQGDGHGKRLLHSSDGGKHWSWLPKAPSWSPSFSDAQHGVTLASHRQSYGGGVLSYLGLSKTNNGGHSWRKLTDPCSRSDEGEVASAGSNQLLWVACVGFQEVGTEAKVIFRSDDRGQSWSEIPGGQSRKHGLPSVGYIEEISVEPCGEGAIVIDGGLWLSKKQGTSWRLAHSGHAGANADFVTAQRKSSNDIVAIRYGRRAKQLVRSHDGGRRWKLLYHWPNRIRSKTP